MNLRLKITLASAIVCPLLFAETIAIIGGTGSTGPALIPYAALIDSEGGVHPLSNMPFSPGNPNDQNSIASVAMNSSGMSIMVGHQGTGGTGGGGEYIGLVDPAGNVQVFASSSGGLELLTCAINASGNGICAGTDGSARGFRVDPVGNLTPFTPGGTGGFGTIDMNDTGLAVTGGNGIGRLGFLLPAPNSVALQSLGFINNISSVSTNSSGYSILASDTGVCELFDQNGVALHINNAGSAFNSVSLNNVKIALIGGASGAAPFANRIDATTPIKIDLNLGFL